MGYRTLATAVLVVHFCYLGYVVLGGFAAWRWRWTFWPHLAAAGWGLVIVTLPVRCPLTVAENWARSRAGQDPAAEGFIDRHIEGVLYPERYTRLLQVLVVVIVLTSWLGGYLRHRRHDGTGRRHDHEARRRHDREKRGFPATRR